jgi:hypothetical protein
MKKSILLIIAIAGLFSCKQGSKLTQETVDIGTSNSVKNLQNDKNISTKYEYADSKGGSLIILNGLPRGGVKYTDPNGDDYNYAVFWTQITNQTDNPLELKMDVPVDSYEVPALPGKYYKVLIPADSMTYENFPLFNFGLIESFLDKSIDKSVSLKGTINPKGSIGFYFVILCLTEGAHGTGRTELRLKGQNLFYRINIDGTNSNSKSSDMEFLCGRINLKNLILQK